MRVILKCDGCGILKPWAKGKPHADGGHHVIPDDPEKDWICHGSFLEVETPPELTKEDVECMRLDAAQPTRAKREMDGAADLRLREARAAGVEGGRR